VGELTSRQIDHRAQPASPSRPAPKARRTKNPFARPDVGLTFRGSGRNIHFEGGLLVAGPQGWRLDGPLPPFAIPATLQDSLAARLDRLAPVKEIAQIGAAIGREFSYPLLRAVAGRDEPALRAALAQLEDAELLFRSGAPPDARYTFKHALVQDTAYETLLRSRRQILHRQIADALRGEFPAVVAAEPELVAHHLTQAGLDEPAIEWWGKAGDQALRRSAFKEAAAHLGKAIEWPTNSPRGRPAPRRASTGCVYRRASAMR
jgi:hypothetical protein